MSDIDPKLVQEIARQVIDALRAKEAGSKAPAQASPTQAGPASIHPPIGICTGDYSKFPELEGKLYSRLESTPAEHGEPRQAAVPQPALSGIITASQLQAAIEASPDRVALLAPDARPTPLASDLIRQHPERVRRSDTPAPAGNAGSGSFFWWIDGVCPTAQAITRTHSGQLRPITAPRTPSSLIAVLRESVALVRSRQVVGGVLFVQHAAEAVCFANRCDGLRAFAAASVETIDQAVRGFAGNLLVMEYPRVGPKQMTAMVERMLTANPQPQPLIQRRLAELHRL